MFDTFSETVYDTVLLPGRVLQAVLVEQLPALAARLELDGQLADASSIALALIAYLLLASLAYTSLLLFRNAARFAGAIARTLLFRSGNALRGLKTRLVIKLRELFPARYTGESANAATLDFDDVEMAILRYASRRGAGFTLSAPELAEYLTLRPAQIERVLTKLRDFRMLDPVIGSTEGYDNYRLTDSGANFVALWERQ